MHIPRKKIRFVLAAGTAALLFLLWGGPGRLLHAAQRAYSKMMVLTMVLDKIERFYVDDRDPNALIDQAINGLLGALDPHSVYLTADRVRQLQGHLSGL